MAREYSATTMYRDAAAGAAQLRCAVCLGARVTHAFLPCGHACACSPCIAGGPHAPPLRRCPVCVQSFVAAVPVGPDVPRLAAEAWAESVGACGGATQPVDARFTLLFARAAAALRRETDPGGGGAGGRGGAPPSRARGPREAAGARRER